MQGMRVVVINTGTELLLGDVVNSHLAFIAREILPSGLRVDRQLTVPDGVPIRAALIDSFQSADIVFVTGGLGPTTDDITLEVTAELLGAELRRDETVMAAISARAARRGFRLTDRVFRQADVPVGATVLSNEWGSAPGVYFPSKKAPEGHPHLFLLPGPPRELEPMFRKQVLPILREIVPTGSAIELRTYRITGMGESLVEEAVGERLLEIPEIELGYCARPGEVDLRVIGPPPALAEAERVVTAGIGNAVFSRDGQSLEETVVGILIKKKKTLAVAESCTGGCLANRITNVPGASAVFLAGYVTYANEAKARMIGVDQALISEHGSVSEPVAQAMAEGARNCSGAAYALATTGIAGPGGGTEAKPVGTVFIALASDQGATVVRKLWFPDERQMFKNMASQTALELLRRAMLGLR